MQRRRLTWGVLGISGLIVLLLGMTALNTRWSQQAGATPICPTNWADSADRSVTLSCSALFATTKEAELATHMQTEIAQAQRNPQVVAESGTSYVQTETPGDPLTIPKVEVDQDDGKDFTDGPEPLRRSTSIWQLGLLPGTKSYFIDRIYMLTRKPENGFGTTLSIFVEGGDIGPNSWPQYNGVWQMPHEMGIMRITSITDVSILATGLTGTATFTTSTGASGTFDLATHAWTITAAGTPVADPQTMPDVTPGIEASATS